MNKRKHNWRNSSKWRRLKRDILIRDGIKCRICGSRRKLEIHHIYDASHYPDKRFDKSNLVTLCRSCHTQYHTNYLRSYRAKSDMYRWINFLDLVRYFKNIFYNEHIRREEL